MWKDLTMAEKAAIIRIAVKHGITDLDNIKNKFDEGGPTNTEGGNDKYKPWYWFTPEYEGNSLKEAIFKAYDDGRKGENILYKGRAYKALLNESEENEYRNKNKINYSFDNYNSLNPEFKESLNLLIKKLNLDVADAENLYNSGILFPAIQARYTHVPTARVRENDSPTKEGSEYLEDKMNKMIYHRKGYVAPNMEYSIPYIEGKEIKVPKVGRVSTNALDSLAKYAYLAKVPLEEALGLSAQETAFGALPFYNYGAEDIDDRALGNSSYFRNYGSIPAENLVRDFRYNIEESPIDRKVPPLLHAFKYWKEGNYNRGDANHTGDVRRKGNEVINTKEIQDWIKESEFAQKVINLFK